MTESIGTQTVEFDHSGTENPTALKLREVGDIFKRCVRDHGISINPDENLCSTRIFCSSILPCERFDSYLDSPSFQKIEVINHLTNIILRQKPSGEIPASFQGNAPPSAKDELKEQKSISCDNELWFILAVNKIILFNPELGEKDLFLFSEAQALKYVESILNNGLIVGSDWRENKDLKDKTLLSNCCLLKEVYNVLGEKDKAANVLNKLNEFWNGTYFDDYSGNHSFDVLGNSLAITFGIATDVQTEMIFNHAMSLFTPYGIPSSPETISPFISSNMLFAMASRGGWKWVEFAHRQFSNWSKLDAFHEFYSTTTGKGTSTPYHIGSASAYVNLYNFFQLMSE
ncbi:MAG: glycogen debranching enzyme alpha-1,6-glucosidase [Harvfovirus sp.]|uniref:Glycogen debranching enzyme alpha-1,6-glucosidase n=1 Tax=Harvfovirus sp. TaxID=2487768 RepID=A0A3G5A1P9_9VIRU|nr:MAG: glycogen debranching enzyme alpha-1,6-glucosidase [Harvfovirus sp.]